MAAEESRRLKILGRIAEIDAAIETSYVDYRRLSEEGLLPMASSENFSGYLARMKTQRGDRQRDLAEQEKRLDAVREELKAAMIRKKSLELLKDKQAKRLNAFYSKKKRNFCRK